MDVIKTTTPKASKNYICDGREQLDRCYNGEPEVSSQIRNCKGIIKGNKYHNETQAENGEIGHFRSCLECLETIRRFKLWEE